MVKSYTRYVRDTFFGVIATGACNICRGPSEDVVFTGGLERANGWDVKKGTACSSYHKDDGDISSAHETTCLSYSVSDGCLAAGYSDGSISVYNTSESEQPRSLVGHRRAVTALCFSSDGSQIASGSQDTDVVVWDVVSETGACRLKAHSGQVTFVQFIHDASKIVTGSKDSTLRVWDIAARHCIQVISVHVGEVWSGAVVGDGALLAVGSVDAELRLYEVKAPNASAQAGAGTAGAGGSASNHMVLKPQGTLRRESTQRVASVTWSDDGNYLAACANGKQLQVWARRSPAEAAKRMKRRLKRGREKQKKHADAGAAELTPEAAAEGPSNPGASAAAASVEEAGEGVDAAQPTAADTWQELAVYRPPVALRGAVFLPMRQPNAECVCRVAAVTGDNGIRVVHVDSNGGIKEAASISHSGHRSDVRAVAVSPDGSRVLSTGNGGCHFWGADSGRWQNHVPTGYGLTARWLPGGAAALVGCREGTIEVVDVGSASVLQQVAAHKGQVWSIDTFPDGSGFVSGGADHTLKTWKLATARGTEGGPGVTATEERRVDTGHDVLCVHTSADGKLVACSLMSNVIKVFYLDTMKWFLDLYGHKLPAVTLDVSSDGKLLVSGAADKNANVWGLDFGDLHRSLFAHQDSVMAVAFVPDTHLFFSAGKDRMVKYWDADKFQLLLELPGHHAEVWCLSVSPDGSRVFSGGHDRSVRVWTMDDDPLFLDEEQEKRLERLFEATPARGTGGEGQTGAGDSGPVALQTRQSMHSSERILDALDMARNADERQKTGEAPNLLMHGLSGAEYVFKAISDVRATDLEAALLTLHFTDAMQLLDLVPVWLKDVRKVELSVRVAGYILSANHARVAGTVACRPVLAQLHDDIRSQLQGIKNMMGFNLAGLKHIATLLRDRDIEQHGDRVPVKRKFASTA